MLEFIIHNWEEADYIAIPELRETMARFQISCEVEGEAAAVTKYLRHSAQTVTDAITIPLYPMAEAILRNWWFIFCEPRSNVEEKTIGFDHRHDLFYGREGFAMPHLSFVSNGSSVDFNFYAPRAKYLDGEFLNKGYCSLAQDELENVFRTFLDTIMGRLDAKEIYKTELHQEYQRVLELDEEEQEFCELASRLGIDPFATTEEQERLIFEAYNSLPKDILGEFFSATSQSTLKSDSEDIQNALEKLEQGDTSLGALASLKEKLSTSSTPKVRRQMVWKSGYERADLLRKELGINGKMLKTYDDIGSAFGLNGDAFPRSISRTSNFPNYMKVLESHHKNDGPKLAVFEGMHHVTEKFSVCRALHDYLFLHDRETSLVTQAHSAIQQQNRAFAAEFLAPAEFLSKKAKNGRIFEEEIQVIADELNVSDAVIRHQFENHELAEIIS